RPSAHEARALPAVLGPPRPRPDPGGDRRPQRLQGRADRSRRSRRRARRRVGAGDDPARTHSALESGQAGSHRQHGEAEVRTEIVEAVQTLEKEKGISSERLMKAREDALLSAYKKTPGAA